MARLMLLLCIAVTLFQLAMAQTCTPSDPSPGTSINPVAYDSFNSQFAALDPAGDPQYATAAWHNGTLQLRVIWNATNNRTFQRIGIGAIGQCDSQVFNPVPNAIGGWAIGIPEANCTTTASADYYWPSAYYDANCAPEFDFSNTSTEATLTFTIYVNYLDCANITRNGVLEAVCNNVTTELPVQVHFPLTATVDTLAPVAVFSASSVNITAALASQSLSPTNPALAPTATFTFITLVGESFQLASYSITGPAGLLAVTINSVNNTLEDFTRRQTWQVDVTVGVGSCNINGLYTANFTIWYTASNGSGSNTLSPDQNPIPNNASALVTFTLESADFCASFNNNTVSAVMYPYRLNLSNYFDGATSSPHSGFLTGDSLYLAVRVTSNNLPILTTTISNLYFYTSGDPTLVFLDPAVVALQYGSAIGGFNVGFARTDAVVWITLDPATFVVPGDQNVQYFFHAEITISYNQDGQKRRDQIVQLRGVNARRASRSTVSADTTAFVAAGVNSSFASSGQASLLTVCVATLAASLLY